MPGYRAGETVRVLLVSAKEETRDEIAEALEGWSSPHQVFWISQPELAPARVLDIIPHVLVVDDALGGANPVSLIKELTQRVPAAAIVALVDEEDIGQARQAVLAGASSFITKPLRSDEILSTLRQTGARQAQPAQGGEPAEAMEGTIIAICAPKGGTGRTLIAINTAVSLQMMTGQPVALVDADYAAPSIDVALNLHPGRNVADLLPRITRLDPESLAGTLASHNSGIQVLLAPEMGALADPISLPQAQQILVLMKRMFRWVLADVGLPLDETACGFLDAADRILVTLVPELGGLRNTRLMLDQFKTRGYHRDKTWLILNRATLRAGVSQADIQERLHMEVAHRIPDDQPLATLSLNRGVPLVVSHRHSAVARSIRSLAKRLVQEETVKEPAGAPEGSQKRWLPSLRSVNVCE